MQPLLVLKGLLESVSMDFMVGLPPSRGFDAIMVVVDQFNKITHFIPIKETTTAQETEGYSSHTHVQASWPPQGHYVKSRPKAHKQVLVSLVEAYGVRIQDEHFIPSLNRWTN